MHFLARMNPQSLFLWLPLLLSSPAFAQQEKDVAPIYQQAKELRTCAEGKEACAQKALKLFHQYSQAPSRQGAPSVLLGPEGERSKVAVLIHGYDQSAKNKDIKTMAAELHRQGYTVLTIQLEGHSVDGKTKFADVTEQDWKNDVQFALDIAQHLGEKTTLTGYSLGGMLAVHTAITQPEAVDELILVSPALWLNVPLASEACLGKDLIESSFVESVLEVFVSVSEKEKDYIAGSCPLRRLISEIEHSLPYKESQFCSQCDAEKGLAKTEPEDFYSHMRRVFKQIKVPTYVAYNEKDGVVDSMVTKIFAESVQNKKVVVEKIPAPAEVDSNMAHVLAVHQWLNMNPRPFRNFTAQ